MHGGRGGPVKRFIGSDQQSLKKLKGCTDRLRAANDASSWSQPASQPANPAILLSCQLQSGGSNPDWHAFAWFTGIFVFDALGKMHYKSLKLVLISKYMRIVLKSVVI